MLGGCARYVFVTSTMYSGNLGGLTGADALCQARATAAGLPGTYRAWLSASNGSPSTRFTRSAGRYVLPDGSIVANDWADLTDGEIQRNIDRTEFNGAAPIGNTACAGGGEMHRTAWSATSASGTSQCGGSNCSDWTSTSGSACWGWVNNTNNQAWSSWCSGGSCGWLSPLYCFQQ